MAGNVIHAEKNTCVLPEALSARLHGLHAHTELTVRGHSSVPGCRMDTFQPRVVVHLCFAAVGIKQQHGCGVLTLVISIYLTFELNCSLSSASRTLATIAVVIGANKHWIQRT